MAACLGVFRRPGGGRGCWWCSDTAEIMSEGSGRSPRLTAIPAARSSAPVLRIRIIAVLGLLVLASLLGVVSTVAWLAAGQKEVPVVNLDDALPKAQGFATIVASAYLDGAEMQIPTTEDVKDLPATGYLPHEAPQWVEFGAGVTPTGLTLELHRFLFYRLFPSEDGATPPKRALYELYIPLALTPGGTPALGGQPMFRPVLYGDITGALSTKSETTLPGPVVKTLEKWAGVWAAGNSQGMKEVAGDGTEGVTYTGLGGGCKAKGLTVQNVTPLSTDSWLVRARVSVECANQYVVDMDMDVTVVGGPPNPTRIVGWGAVGSGVLGLDDVRVKS